MSAHAIAEGAVQSGTPLTGQSTELAPYALVRLAALPYPPIPEQSAEFRACFGRLIQLRAQLATVADQLADDLYASAAGHDVEFHRKVVLPLRRDVHNGRLPRPALLDALGDLPGRLPLLREWLEAMAEVTTLRERMVAATPAALAAERAALAATCAAEPLRRAVTLTGADLLRGIDRTAAGGANPDSRTRKGEHNALRYALRANAKTSPLSWFTYVGWGQWAAAGQTEQLGGEPVAVARANRTLLVKIVTAVLAELRDVVPYRLAPNVRLVDGRVYYRRDTPLGYGDRIVAAREEEVSLAHSAPLAMLLQQVRASGSAGITPSTLASELAAQMPGDPQRVSVAAARYVAQVIEGGLLVPIEPASPQDTEAVATVADWLDRWGMPELAGLLREIDTGTRTFPTLPANARVAALAEVKELWQRAFAACSAEWIESPVLAEDVTLRTPLRLGAAHGRDAAADFARLAPMIELFDQYLVFRRLIRDRFVQQYGRGGQTGDLAGFASQMGEVWKAGGLMTLRGTFADESSDMITPELRELAEVRAAVCQAVVEGNPPEADELWLGEEAVRIAEHGLPGWVRGRPASYSFFVQPVAQPGSTLLVLNHIYAGWGRFTSRFLDLIAPEAIGAVAEQVRRGFGPGSRVAQFRPVNGFNANLHPLVVADEVAEDPAWASITPDQLEVFHDAEADQIRLRHHPSGQQLDVLYLGFLVPFILPDRFVPLYLDLSSGLASIDHLAPSRLVGGTRVRPRLRYRDLVLTRARWRVTADEIEQLKTDFTAEGEIPAQSAAAWLARHGLPQQVFIGPEGGDMKGPEDFQRYMGQHKPQFVDFGNALHLRCLPRLLARHDRGVRVEEALPVPGAGNPDRRVVELVIEAYRKGSTR